jgi:hypothetical protein
MSNYDLDHLRSLGARVKDCSLTLTAAASQVRDSEGQPRPLARVSLKALFDRYEVDYGTLPRGRPVTTLEQDFLDIVQERFDEFPMGCTRMFMALQSPAIRERLGCHVTSTQVEMAYEILQLWRYQLSPRLEEPERCRYVACMVNLIWHTDLHQPKDGSPGYYIAFLDDASRKVLYAEFIEHKTALATSAAFVGATCRAMALPYALWSDNGTEFKAEFDQTLLACGADHVLTEPYNPQQNGKMERFWQTLENRAPGRPLLDYIEAYNNAPHTGLPPNPLITDVKACMSPSEAYELIPHWSRGWTGYWRVNGRYKAFDVHKAEEEAKDSAAKRMIPKKNSRRKRIPLHPL